MDQFYMTLPSNSSMDYYPGNTVANYTTHLSRQVQLSGSWQVALVEIHYPCSFHANDESNEIRINAYRELQASEGSLQLALTSGSPTLTGESGASTPQPVEAYTVIESMHTGKYQDVEDLIENINKKPDLANHIVFEYDPITKKVEVTARNNVTKVVLDESLALQLGFDPKEADLKKNNKSLRPANLQLALPSYMYVYCDIVEPQLIGDTTAPLLQIVNIDTLGYVYGAHKYVQFHNPHYIPLIKSCFENVEIDLRNDRGESIPFQFGTSCVKLHFKRVQ